MKYDIEKIKNQIICGDALTYIFKLHLELKYGKLPFKITYQSDN